MRRKCTTHLKGTDVIYIYRQTFSVSCKQTSYNKSTNSRVSLLSVHNFLMNMTMRPYAPTKNAGQCVLYVCTEATGQIFIEQYKSFYLKLSSFLLAQLFKRITEHYLLPRQSCSPTQRFVCTYMRDTDTVLLSNTKVCVHVHA